MIQKIKQFTEEHNSMESIRVITHKNNYFKHADIVKVTTVDNDAYIGQIMPGEEDDSHMPFWEDNIADIEKANDKEVFIYAFNLGHKYENVIL
jgi:hypothetical protein